MAIFHSNLFSLRLSVRGLVLWVQSRQAAELVDFEGKEVQKREGPCLRAMDPKDPGDVETLCHVCP